MEIGLVGLLRLAWASAIFPIIVASIPSSRFNWIHQKLLTFSARGKTYQSSSRRFTVPQKFFSHFYVVAVVWTSILLLMAWSYAHKMGTVVSESTSYSKIASYLAGGSHIFSFDKPHSASAEQRFRAWQSVFLLLLMEVQAARRLYESIHVFNYSSSARMHILGYLTGIFFYTAAPLSLCSNSAPEMFNIIKSKAAEFIVKGRNPIHAIEVDWPHYIYPLMKLGWRQWIGAVIFLWGSVHQSRCHAILGKLRESRELSDDYAIPYGDWFNVVSSGHYLAEIVIYAGMVVASGGMDLTVWWFFGFVVANLALAAGETQRWYRHKFDDYPRNRFALIPYVY